ncbi:putative [histone H3]-lysine(4) N-trimethyltransferase chromatin regulator PHD family [Helianthus annuus]|nr:putative [histone H3]-lysine(4) N-trimethyltransferase chromatin regulator PHD family [Helianthus annuus]KAJ0814776.1 putative histone-lysine N-methyltransferase chromatin regulator PHD family [Helianthus annuus]KAJ0827992.1 putative [histone H3]-lysine(4) N-trimethyltransferase chromatin regulator PHD family [Helianthus annuus]
MAFHVACPITCRRICNCKLGFSPELRTEKAQAEFLEAAARVEAIFNNRSLIYGKSETVEVLVPKVVVMPPPAMASQPIGSPDVVVVDGDVAEELSVQSKRFVMQKKAAAASVVAEDYARRFESGDVAVDLTKDDGDEQSLSNAKVMCRLCFSGENEESERARKMISCKNCNKKYHKSCVKSWAQNRDLFHWSSWTCPSCRSCEVCRRTGDPNKLMFCKRCDGAYHCYCQQPPHKNVSSGPYLCPKHTKCHSCASTVPGNGLSVRWFLGYTCCDACGRLFVKGNYCPVCLKVYRDSESTPMVCCDICQRWVHCHCDGISDEKYLQFQVDNNLQYRCATCRGECYQVRDLEDAVQELWRRRDKADRELIARLRAAAGLPTQEEIFSVQPYSDDEDNKPVTKNEHGRSLKFSLKAPIDKSPKKKSASKKSGKKKGSSNFNLPLFGKSNTRADGFVTSDNNKDESGESEIAGSLTDAVWSNNHVTKTTDKSLNVKKPKLVIHLGSRNKNVANVRPENESSVNGESLGQTKGLRLRGKEGNTIKIRKLNPENDLKPRVSFGKGSDYVNHGHKEKELKPLLRLKFKNPYSENVTTWSPSGVDDRSLVKGQRSKRKRPSPVMENRSVSVREDEGASHSYDDDEIMDANWIIQKLGKDAIGKKVEVHQRSNNTWHKGSVIEVFEGTSVVSVTYDDGKASNVDLGKEGIRFYSQKRKR